MSPRAAVIFSLKDADQRQFVFRGLHASRSRYRVLTVLSLVAVFALPGWSFLLPAFFFLLALDAERRMDQVLIIDLLLRPEITGPEARGEPSPITT